MQAIYDLAREQGDSQLALTAAVVLGEIAPQRLLTSAHLTTLDLSDLATPTDKDFALRLPDQRLTAIIEMARNHPDRRFRLEAIGALYVVRHLGTADQKAETVTLLDELFFQLSAWRRSAAGRDRVRLLLMAAQGNLAAAGPAGLVKLPASGT